jgi:hypothetical protein
MPEQLPALPGVMSLALSGDQLKEARRKALREEGLLGKRTKYGSKEERKKAQKERSKKKREEKKKFLASKGLYAPRVKLSPEQKKLRRSMKSKMRRAAMVEYAKSHPKEAIEAGFNPNRLGTKPKGTRKKKGGSKKKK